MIFFQANTAVSLQRLQWFYDIVMGRCWFCQVNIKLCFFRLKSIYPTSNYVLNTQEIYAATPMSHWKGKRRTKISGKQMLIMHCSLRLVPNVPFSAPLASDLSSSCILGDRESIAETSSNAFRTGGSSKCSSFCILGGGNVEGNGQNDH